jgi:hypothetical protein
MNPIRRWPFLSLAVATLTVGGAWHAAHIQSTHGFGRVLYVLVLIIGAPFIWGQRTAAQLLGHGPLAPIVGFLLGVAPYVVLELERYRRRVARRR